ncbi:MAG: hypothetical protein DMF74_14585 [Acidobacteria bacterium]|nr:MAG: hypothetical protein DMF74_14585 [Acidobacteriota bacterium]
MNVRQTSVCRLLGEFEPRVINDKLKFVGHFSVNLKPLAAVLTYVEFAFLIVIYDLPFTNYVLSILRSRIHDRTELLQSVRRKSWLGAYC